MINKKLLEEIACKEETCIQKTNIALLNQTMTNIETKLDKMEKTMEEFIHSADSRFASKDVEKLVYWILGLVFTGMTGTIIGFIYNATGLTK